MREVINTEKLKSIREQVRAIQPLPVKQVFFNEGIDYDLFNQTGLTIGQRWARDDASGGYIVSGTVGWVKRFEDSYGFERRTVEEQRIEHQAVAEVLRKLDPSLVRGYILSRRLWRNVQTLRNEGLSF